MTYRIFSLLPSQIPFTGQLLDLVGLKPHVLPGRDDRHMDLNLSLHACSRNEVVQREPLFDKVASHFLWRTLGPCCFLLACLYSKYPGVFNLSTQRQASSHFL